MISFPHIVARATSFRIGALPPTFPLSEDAAITACGYPGCNTGGLATHHTRFILKNQENVVRVFYTCQPHHDEVRKVVRESDLCVNEERYAILRAVDVLVRPRYTR